MGQPTRTADTDSRRRPGGNRVAWLTALSLVSPACVGAEPEFHAEALRERRGYEEELTDEEVEMRAGIEALRAAGLERTLSEGEPPPPYLPDEAHAPLVRVGGDFDVAMRGGEPHLLDIRSVAPDETGELVTAEDVLTAEELQIELPRHYQCSTQGSVLEGYRYLLLTWPAEREGRSTLYLGAGAAYSVLRVEDGYVRTPDGAREARALVAEARRGS